MSAVSRRIIVVITAKSKFSPPFHRALAQIECCLLHVESVHAPSSAVPPPLFSLPNTAATALVTGVQKRWRRLSSKPRILSTRQGLKLCSPEDSSTRLLSTSTKVCHRLL